ncbi:MAG: SanA/YdcF family protein [Chloroflexota bacterium]
MWKKLKTLARNIFKVLFTLGAVTGLMLLLSRLVTAVYAKPRVYTVNDAPVQTVAIVFGAGLQRDGSPTPVLRDRVETAAQLYFAGKVQKLLMSGDNRFASYNEPESMRRYAIALGVPDEAIVLDYAGRRTYDTCYRAKAIFGLDEAILVTQHFHLPRALYLCNHLGMNGVGVASDNRYYRKISRLVWNARELPATLTALWEVHISHPLPVLGEFEPIFPTSQ